MKYVSFCGLFYKILPEIGDSTNGRLMKNRQCDSIWVRRRSHYG